MTKETQFDQRLMEFGYAPGRYLCRCSVCDTKFEGDKLAYACQSCAQKAFDVKLSEGNGGKVMEDNKTNEQVISGNDCGSRLNGKTALREAIDRLRSKADNYEALLRFLPDEMDKDADEGLWLIAMKIQR